MQNCSLPPKFPCAAPSVVNPSSYLTTKPYGYCGQGVLGRGKSEYLQGWYYTSTVEWDPTPLVTRNRVCASNKSWTLTGRQVALWWAPSCGYSGDKTEKIFSGASPQQPGGSNSAEGRVSSLSHMLCPFCIWFCPAGVPLICFVLCVHGPYPILTPQVMLWELSLLEVLSKKQNKNPQNFKILKSKFWGQFSLEEWFSILLAQENCLITF